MRSRLKTNIKKQNTKTVIGIILILIIVVVFGMKFLIGYSVILEKLKGTKANDETTQTVEYVAPPVLNPIPEATKDSKINISGYTQSNNVTIKLYVNSALVGKTSPKSDYTFSFENVSLNEGANEIKAQTSMESGKNSDFSQSLNINYLNKQPSLDVSFPQDGQTFKKDESPIIVKGKTDKDVKVTVNDFWTIQQDDGTFTYSYKLNDGDNNLKIVALDTAGNKTEKDVKIKVE